jgi:peroxiredoxin
MELLRDRRSDFDAAGVQPVGISRDSPWTHIAWTQTLDLNFGLLSDLNGDATRALGIGIEFRGFHDVSARSAFLVDRQGTIRGAWSYETGELPDVDELLEAARALKSSAHPA